MTETYDALLEGNPKLVGCFPIPPPDQNIIESTQMFIKKLALSHCDLACQIHMEKFLNSTSEVRLELSTVTKRFLEH